MKALLQGIISEISGTDFATNIGSRLFLAEAPPDSTMPYCVYNVISEMPDEYFSGADLEEITLSFSIFSEDESAIEANDLFENLKTCFDNCDLSVTGYTHVYMWRDISSLIRDPESNVWQYNVDYEVMVQS